MLNLRRLVNKESPLWGFLVGLTLTGAVVAVTDTAVLRPLENVALDVRFRNRPPIPLSPELIMVDIDDDSINFLGPLPWARDRHAGVVRQLHDLGARVIVMDIRFVRPLPDLETPFDPQAGRFEPDAVNERLVRSVGGAGNVLVVYEFDIGQALPPADLMAAVPRMAELLGKDANADEERLQGASGLSPKRYASAANLLRRLGLQAAITERVRGQSGLTYLDIESKLFPNGPLSPRHLLDVRIAWDVVQAKGMVRGKGSQAIEGGSVATQDGLLTNPPMLDLGEAILASGLTNATVDADGILRRPPLLIDYQGRSYPHVGLQAAAAWYASDGASEATLERGAGEQLFFRVRLHDEVTHDVLLRLDSERQGCALLNWTGVDKTGGLPRISYSGVYDLWDLRHFQLQSSIDLALAGLDEEPLAEFNRKFPDAMGADPFGRAGANFGSHQLALAEALVADYDALMAPALQELEALVRRMPEGSRPRQELEEQLQVVKNGKFVLRQNVEQIKARESQLRDYVAGKICFIGVNATAAGDLHATPLDDTVPGVNVLASVTNMILMDEFLVTLTPGTNRLLTFLVGMFTAILCSIARPRTSLAASLGIVGGFVGVAYALFAYKGVVLAVAGPMASIGLTYIGVVTYREITEFRARRKLENELTGQTHPEIVRLVLEDPERLNKPHKIVGTVFFSDLAGFTGISEAMDPEHLTRYINRCHEFVADHIVESKGYVDKFMGDGIMAVFGALTDDPDHAMKACSTALASVASIEELNREFKQQNLPSVALRIGINTGEFTTGMVGSATRRNFTAMGDVVNVGARFEPLNKMYGSTILIGPETRKAVGDAFLTRELDLIRVKGRREPMPVHELICASVVAGQKRLQVQAYTEARAHFLARRWREAIDAFSAYVEKFGEDGAVSLYLTRAIAFNDRPPPDDWDAAFDMGFK